MKVPKSTHKVQEKKTEYISDHAFGDLKEALDGALVFERGEKRDLQVTRIRAPHPPNTDTEDRQTWDPDTMA